MKLKRAWRRDHRFFLLGSDFHIFHACGMIPRNYRSNSGNPIMPNIGQEYLLECYEHLVKSLPDQIDGLFLLGDIGEGQNLAEQARELSEVDPIWQARGSQMVLKPLTDRVVSVNGQKNIYMTAGSGYHTGRGAEIEEHIGDLIGARRWHGKAVPPWRELMMGDVMLDLAHHQSFTIRYSSMPLEREAGFKFERYGRARRDLPSIIIIARAHVHKGYRLWQEDDCTWCISLPPFKLQDRFAKSSRYPNRMVPSSIGMVGIKIYDKPVDNVRVHVVPYLYDHPEDPVEELNCG